jgi:hypothetical protein
MSTKRQVINSFRKKLQELGADSTYTNQFLYQALMEQAKWLIKREIHSGRIYSNNSFFQVLGCQEVIETSTIDECCPIKVNCKIYRTKEKLPETWVDNDGPVLKSVTSVDGSTEFFVISPGVWTNKKNDPYMKMSKDIKYAFISENYIWFPEHNPHRVNITGFYTDDISDRSACKDKKDCVRFLDTEFMLPGWLEAEMMAKALQQMMVTKQLPEDAQIDKNTNRKN